MALRFAANAGAYVAIVVCTACSSSFSETQSDEADITAEELATGAADWANYARTPRRTSFNPLESQISPSNVSTLVENWACCAPQGPAIPRIALWREQLFVTNVAETRTFQGQQVDAHGLLALDPATGAVHWDAPLAEDFDGTFDFEAFTSEMAIGFGRLHVQYTNFSPVLSTQTGKLLGNSALKTGMDDPISAPLVKGNVIVAELAGEFYSEIGDYRHTVFASSADTGARLWRQPIGQPFVSVPRTPAFANGHVVTVKDDENRLLRIDASTGSIVWSSPMPDRLSTDCPEFQGNSLPRA